MQGAVNLVLKIFQIVRFAHVLHDAAAQCPYCRVNVCIGTDHDHADRNIVGRYPLHHFQTGNVGEIDVEQDKIDLLRFER